MVGSTRSHSPFEVIYSLLFLGAGAAVSVDFLSLMTKHGGLSAEYTIAVLFLTLFLLFQYIRMYYHLHTFDEYQERGAGHFVSALSGKSRFLERLLRLILAGILILTSTSINLDSFMARVREIISSLYSLLRIKHSSAAIPPDVSTIVAPYSVALLGIFVILIVWDFNICSFLKQEIKAGGLDSSVRATAESFYYTAEIDALCHRHRYWYSRTPKFKERLFGLAFSLCLLCILAFESWLLMIAAVICMIKFLQTYLGSSREGGKIVSQFFLPIKTLGEYLTIDEVIASQRQQNSSRTRTFFLLILLLLITAIYISHLLARYF